EEFAVTLNGAAAEKSELKDGAYTVYFALEVLEREIASADVKVSDYDLDLDADGVKVTTDTAGIKLDGFGLCVDTDGTAADGKITHNVQYYLKAIVSAEAGYYYGEEFAVTLNGAAAEKSELKDGAYTVYFKLAVLERDTVVVGGKITNYLDFTKTITVELYKAGSETPAYTTTAVGENALYSFGAVEPGEYILKVSKDDHVTREYAVTADSTDITLDLKIHLRGDINGDGRVNTTDVGLANAHAKKTNLLTDYRFACADVSGDGRVNTTDVGRINAHAKKTNPLW
ncbi:MAG: dockerin type I repeat-containing protein, partial [Clostridia bacterium]|nr:dockerin type I repeat-containing protein [Clostridia bacterium]